MKKLLSLLILSVLFLFVQKVFACVGCSRLDVLESSMSAVNSGGRASITTYDEGVFKGNISTINVVGSDINLTVLGSTATIYLTMSSTDFLNISASSQTKNSGLTLNGTLTATKLVGDGSGITNISGFVTLSATQTFSGQNTFLSTVTAAGFIGSGSQLTGIPGTAFIQQVSTQTGSYFSGTTVLPIDDTIPQNTEGDQYLQATITPTVSTNVLVIEAIYNVANSGTNNIIGMGLFQDSTANALAASWTQGNIANNPVNLSLKYTMIAGTIAATTFKIRIGGGSAGTTQINGGSGVRYLGGVLMSGFTVTERKP